MMYKSLFLVAFLTGCATIEAQWKKEGYCLPVCNRYSSLQEVESVTPDGPQTCVCAGRKWMFQNGFRQVPATARVGCSPDCQTLSKTLER